MSTCALEQIVIIIMSNTIHRRFNFFSYIDMNPNEF
jgi:hypothetical protein